MPSLNRPRPGRLWLISRKRSARCPASSELSRRSESPGAWDEFKSVQLNPNSALPNKYKELIGLGLAAQIPCGYCSYFHTKGAQANGATEREIKEAAVAQSSRSRLMPGAPRDRFGQLIVFRRVFADALSREVCHGNNKQRSNESGYRSSGEVSESCRLQTFSEREGLQSDHRRDGGGSARGSRPARRCQPRPQEHARAPKSDPIDAQRRALRTVERWTVAEWPGSNGE